MIHHHLPRRTVKIPPFDPSEHTHFPENIPPAVQTLGDLALSVASAGAAPPAGSALVAVTRGGLSFEERIEEAVQHAQGGVEEVEEEEDEGSEERSEGMAGATGLPVHVR